MNINIVLYKKIQYLMIRSMQLRNVVRLIEDDWEKVLIIREEQNKIFKQFNFYKQLQKAICENGKSNRALLHR